MVFTEEQRIWLVQYNIENKGRDKYVALRTAFFDEFGTEAPSQQSICKLVKKFKETGSIGNRPKNRINKIRSPENVAAVAQLILFVYYNCFLWSRV